MDIPILPTRVFLFHFFYLYNLSFICLFIFSRFIVESVPGDTNIDASKHTRNKQILDKHMAHMAVSRPPVLSAIEEGNTIRSVKVGKLFKLHK